MSDYKYDINNMYLSPWKYKDYYLFNEKCYGYVREILGTTTIYIIHRGPDNWHYYDGDMGSESGKVCFTSLMQAMNDFDHKLTEYHNPTFLTQEQWDKFSVLI
jgi:hypothetical protein